MVCVIPAESRTMKRIHKSLLPLEKFCPFDLLHEKHEIDFCFLFIGIQDPSNPPDNRFAKNVRREGLCFLCYTTEGASVESGIWICGFHGFTARGVRSIVAFLKIKLFSTKSCISPSRLDRPSNLIRPNHGKLATQLLFFTIRFSPSFRHEWYI